MPELFTHIGMKLGISSKEGGCRVEIELYSTVEDIPLFDAQQDGYSLNFLKDKASAFAENVIQNITSESMSELERADAIYEYLIKNVEYGNIDDSYCYTAYGALVKGLAVCQGYSGAFNMLCDAAGVKSLAVYNDEHMWNVVLAEGKMYHYDVTFDDAGDTSYKKYYRISESEFIADNDHKNYVLPLPELFIK